VRRPRPTVTLSVKVTFELADVYYRLVNKEYGGNVSAAMRDAIEDQIKKKGYELHINNPNAHVKLPA